MTLNRGPDGIWSRNLEEEKLQREGCFASEFLSKPHTKFHNSNRVTLDNFPGESHLRVPLPLSPHNLGETELGEFQTKRDQGDERSQAWTNFQVGLSDSHRGLQSQPGGGGGFADWRGLLLSKMTTMTSGSFL